MTAVTNFLKNNMLFWLLPTLLLVVKLVYDLIPYKPFFFSLTIVIMGITAIIVKKNRLDLSISATRELLEFEFEDEDDISKYGAKSAEDRKRKVCCNLSDPTTVVNFFCAVIHRDMVIQQQNSQLILTTIFTEHD